MINKKNAIFFAIMATIFLSSKVLFVKLTLSNGLSAEQILFLRMLFATPIFLIIYFIYRRKNISGYIHTGKYIIIFLTGVFGFFLSPLLDFQGTQYVSATIERVLIFTYPLFVFVFSLIFKKTHFNMIKAFSLIGMVTGLFLSVGGYNSFVLKNTYKRGAYLILLASISYAISLILAEKIVHSVGSIVLTTLNEISAFIVLVIYNILADRHIFISILTISLKSYILIFGMVIFSTVIPFFVINECIKILGAINVSIIGVISPVFTSFMDVLVLKEHIDSLQIIGCTIIILSILVMQLFDRVSIKA